MRRKPGSLLMDAGTRTWAVAHRLSSEAWALLSIRARCDRCRAAGLELSFVLGDHEQKMNVLSSSIRD